MKKMILIFALLFAVAGICFLSDCVEERKELQNNVVRLHVVANSNTPEDQAIKLQVRDAVVSYLNVALKDVHDIDCAKTLLSVKLGEIEEIAAATLRANGSMEEVSVSLRKESFDTRYYDTFALPAGVYSSLRILIGNAEGKNWWCVVFPSLCLPATGDGFEDTAASAGFSDSLTGSLTGKKQYRIRFFIMDFLGNLENFFGLR